MFDTIPINSPTRTFVDTKLHYNLHGGQITVTAKTTLKKNKVQDLQ